MAERLVITQAKEPFEFEQSAMLLTVNDPWAALGRTYEYNYKKVYEADGELYVAKYGMKVVGCLLLEMHSTLKAFVRALCVSKEFRCNGIGAKLLSCAEHRAFKETGNVFIFTSTERGKKFYERCGYEEIGCIRDLNVTGVHEHLMRKTIGPNQEISFKALEVIVMSTEAETMEEAINLAGAEMHRRGFVSKRYAQKCIERERSFSTGLPLEIPIAIPHTDEEYVHRNCLCIQRVKKPVSFIEMAGTEPLPCQMVINMGLVGAGSQVTMLSKMIEVLQDANFVDVCLHGSEQEVCRIVIDNLGNLD